MHDSVWTAYVSFLSFYQITAVSFLCVGKFLNHSFCSELSRRECPVGLVVARATAERGVLGSIPESEKSAKYRVALALAWIVKGWKFCYIDYTIRYQRIVKYHPELKIIFIDHHHHVSPKTSTGHKHPPSVASVTSSILLASSGFLQNYIDMP